eukprot:TRINITY_DN3064_c0_g2_i1.p1 TRINITY_DN3064_c0_g2~~TRINITY_DN3064_c0_g2_i1.p1  ORF type:complete len:666 (+),score=197.86 TRINITY_DN3064_c0_g2_i1:156-2153(+)
MVNSSSTISNENNKQPHFVETDKAEALPADTIQNYVFLKHLGSGSFASVYLCMDRSTQETYAIKRIEIKDSIPVAVRREIAIMKQMSHPHIVQFKEVLDVSATQNCIYIVMEYVNGNSAIAPRAHKIKPMSDVQIRFFVRDIASALYYIHNIGIVHRDLKPENMLKTMDGHIKLVDFGLALEVTAPKSVRSVAGTPSFLAPEAIKYYQHTKQKKAAAAIDGAPLDIWSLGVTLYFMFFGKLPFDAKSTGDLFNQIVSSPINIPKWFLDHPARDLLIGCLRRKASDRLSINDIINYDWLTESGKEPVKIYDASQTNVSDTEVEKALTAVDDLVLLMRKSFELSHSINISRDHLVSQIDFHSVFNIVNVCATLFEELTHKLANFVKLPVDQLIQEYFSATNDELVALKNILTKPRNEIIEGLADFTQIVQKFQNEVSSSLSLLSNMGSKDFSSENSDESEVIRDLADTFGEKVLPIVKQRASELVQRADAPEAWVNMPIADLIQHFNDLANAVTQNSKLTGGNVSLTMDPEEFASINEQGHLLKFVFEGGTHLHMPPVLEDVIRDLIFNSRKYSPIGTTITAHIFNTKNSLHISISDFGYGFDSEKELYMCVQYGVRKMKNSSVRNLGLGFGLTKAVLITEFFKGTFKISTAPKMGTRIKIKLPRPE